MDPIKRGHHSLRRFFRAQAHVRQIDFSRPVGVREFAARSGETSLRRLIGSTVATFVPPQLPLADTNIVCTRALVEFHRPGGNVGGFQLAAELKTEVSQPVAFIVGFVTNVDEYWACLFGALNSRSDSWATSRSSWGVFYGYGGSAWLGQDYDRAREHGVTFRLHSTLNLLADPRTLLGEWAHKFDRRLGRLLSLLDLDETAVGGAGMDIARTDAVAGDDGVLSFSVRLLFE